MENIKQISRSSNNDIVYVRGNWQEFVEGFRKGAGLSDKDTSGTDKTDTQPVLESN